MQACHTQAIDVSRDKFEVGDKADYIYKLYAGPILQIKANSKVSNLNIAQKDSIFFMKIDLHSFLNHLLLFHY